MSDESTHTTIPATQPYCSYNSCARAMWPSCIHVRRKEECSSVAALSYGRRPKLSVHLYGACASGPCECPPIATIALCHSDTVVLIALRSKLKGPGALTWNWERGNKPPAPSVAASQGTPKTRECPACCAPACLQPSAHSSLLHQRGELLLDSCALL